MVKVSWPKASTMRSAVFSPRPSIIPDVRKRLMSSVVDGNISEDEIFEMAMSNDTVKKFVSGKSILKKIYVKGKILNIVTD